MNLPSGHQMLLKWSPTGCRRASVLIISLLAASLWPVALYDTGLRVNITGSMPRGIYHLHASLRHVTRGDTVAACPPLHAASLGLERGYLGPGTCPDSVEPLLKIVVATEGDIVVTSPAGTSVNGKLLPESQPLQVDSVGRSLVCWSTPTYRMPSGRIWLYAPSDRSWDSRYWGPVPIANVLGIAELLRTTQSRRTQR
jgi:conjugative transfer signal peptidase TraF